MLFNAFSKYWFRTICLVFIFQDCVMADGTVIDKIYHPYVQLLEQEMEFRGIFENGRSDQMGDLHRYRLGYGRSFYENWFGELYLIGEKNDNQGFKLEAYEIEALWQITDQGEYAADWGLLIEVEKSHSEDIMEVSVGLLTEKEWGRWTGTTNIYSIYEFGDDVDTEFETALGAQVKYRYSRGLEPALEFYSGEDTLGLGPVIMGAQRLGATRQIRWEAGVIIGLNSDTPNQTFRLLLEYEY